MKKINILSVFAVILLSVTLFGANPTLVKAISVNTCTDGIDNDFNSLSDDADPSCATGTIEGGSASIPEQPTSSPVLETTYALCTDGIDNDFNSLSDAAEPSCSTVLNPTPVIEITLALCTDGIDNDFNSLSDAAEPSCAPVLNALTSTSSTTSAGVPENTYALCTDGIDNDFNSLSDAAEPACASVQAPATTPTTTPTTTTAPIDASKLGPIGGGSSGGGFSGGTAITVGTPISATATSTVVGIDPNCSKLFKTYMGLGKKNDKAEVRRLQAFLNEHMNAKLAVDGSFGNKTKAAVKAFQTKYASTILLPWDVAKLSTNLVSNPTGYVYKTTRYQLNLLVCPAYSAPAPKLP